jgi:hypothetical protein
MVNKLLIKRTQLLLTSSDYLIPLFYENKDGLLPAVNYLKPSLWLQYPGLMTKINNIRQTDL